MGGIGGCCDEPCCDTLTIPTDWYAGSDCCAKCETTYDNEWTVVCSDVIRSDDRNATGEYKYYLKLYPVNPTGPFPDPNLPCDLEEYLCATLTEYHSITTAEKLVVKYRKISRTASVAMISLKCDEEESPVCHYLASCRDCYEIQYGQVVFTDSEHTITGTGSTCCPIGTLLRNDVETALTCEARAAMSLPEWTVACLVRNKLFVTPPTGSITFVPGDAFDCEDLGVCIDRGVDYIDIVSFDSGATPWTAPTCNSAIDQTDCFVIGSLGYHSECCNAADVPGAGTFIGETTTTVCNGLTIDFQNYTCTCHWQWDGFTWIELFSECDNYSGLECYKVANGLVDIDIATTSGQLLDMPGFQLGSDPYFPATDCTINCAGETFQDRYNSKETCEIISTYHSESGYTARTVRIEDVSDWVISLTEC